MRLVSRHVSAMPLFSVAVRCQTAAADALCSFDKGGVFHCGVFCGYSRLIKLELPFMFLYRLTHLEAANSGAHLQHVGYKNTEQ